MPKKNLDGTPKARIHLFEKGDFTWALFIGHLVIEKLLKALYVINISNSPPFIHDLIRIAEKVGLPLNEDQKDILDTISAFNLRARYDDYKMEFHRKCTREFTEKWIQNIKELSVFWGVKDSLLLLRYSSGQVVCQESH